MPQPMTCTRCRRVLLDTQSGYFVTFERLRTRGEDGGINAPDPGPYHAILCDACYSACYDTLANTKGRQKGPAASRS